MTTNKFSMLLAAVAVSFTACNNNEEPGVNNDGEPTIATITLKSANLTSYAETETGNAQESKINFIEFYVFNSDGTPDADGAYTKVENPTGSNFTLRVRSGNNKKVVAIANTDLGEVANYTALRTKFATYNLNETTSRNVATNGFQMSGESTTNIVEGSNFNRVDVRIARNVSKVEGPILSSVAVEMPKKDIEELYGEGTTVTNADIAFEYNGFAVINGLDKSDALFVSNAAGDMDQEWTDWSWAGKTYHQATYNAEGFPTNIYSGTNGGWLLGDTDLIYVYENQPRLTTVNGYEGFSKESTYSFLVAGTLKVDGEEDIDRYWRVYLIKEDNYTIYRNTIYRVAVTKILTNGYATPEEADEDKKIDVIPPTGQTTVVAEISIEPWNVKISETEM